jgi:hypothetical protein
VPVAQAYNTTLYVLAGLLVLGFLANLAMRPVDGRFHMTDDELSAVRARGHEAVPARAR